MKKYVYLAFWTLVVCACGGDDDNNNYTVPKVVDIDLSKQSIDITFGGSEVITCNNVNATELDIAIDDDYVAYVSTSKNSINIVSRHVGRTQITVSKNGSKKTIDVTVRPSLNLIGMPYTLFGESKETIKSKYSPSEIWLDEDNQIAVHEKHDYLKLSHFYIFKNDKLQFIETMSYHDQQTNKYFSKYQDQMIEYAAYPYEDSFKYYNAYSYTYVYNRNNNYYIGLMQVNSNIKGWYVYYAKTIEELKSK